MLSGDLKKELYVVGARRGHYQGFLSLLAHEQMWSEARSEYPHIAIPTLLVYGQQDWAPIKLRQEDQALIPGTMLVTVSNGGHFLSLDQPEEFTQHIVRFIATEPSSRGTSTRGPPPPW